MSARGAGGDHGPRADEEPRPGGPGRPRWVRVALEIALLALAWAAYTATRLSLRGGVGDALRNGRRVYSAQGGTVDTVELPLNRFAVRHAALGIPADWYYATAHYAWTLVVLLWLWNRRPASYGRARTVLVVATVLGLVVFVLFPVAPPRLLPGLGFADAMARWSHWGFWGGAASAPRGAEHLTNEFAAMPSLHMGWALWCARWLWALARHRWVRWAAWLHPLLTGIVVVSTGNHFVLDLVGGAGVWLLAEAAVAAVGRRGGRPGPPRPVPPEVSGRLRGSPAC